MNYEEARQIGPTGPAPGKWNWTNFNDGVQSTPYTIAPCAFPDFKWPAFDPSKGISGGLDGVKPTGRERCDHDTREEAERHHYDHELASVKIVPLDLEGIRSRQRCDYPECAEWETHAAQWPGGYLVDSLCDAHASIEAVAGVHPFYANSRTVHS